MRGGLVGERHVDPTAVEEADEAGLVLHATSSAGEAGTQLAEHDERHEDFVRPPEALDRLGYPLGEIDVAVRVDRDSHRQSASSMRSCAWIAASKPGSSTHEPTSASRSEYTRSGTS